LSDLKDCVVVLDEFEKMFKKNGDEGMTPQESLLSVLDGTKSLSHNLYLLSVNDVFSLNENLISRPGRIRYHFRYENISEVAIEEYCKDNLIKSRWNDIKDVVDVLRGSRVQSLDIVQSIVKEMNAFPNMNVEDIAQIMNISESKLEIDIAATFSLDGHQFSVTDTWTTSKGLCKGWLDEYCYIKFKFKEVSLKPAIIPTSNIQIDRWQGFYPDVTINDPFWASFKDEDGDIWISAGDQSFRKKHELKLECMTISKHIDFGAY
jgi:SpoVK/Ycf46/Vps4 family AAA+-type ATPase